MLSYLCIVPAQLLLHQVVRYSNDPLSSVILTAPSVSCCNILRQALPSMLLHVIIAAPHVVCMQDPTLVLDEYGADALRLYLINSPVVRGETLRFKKEGVFAVVKDVFLPWYNAYRFLVQNVLRLQQQSGIAFEPTKVTHLLYTLW